MYAAGCYFLRCPVQFFCLCPAAATHSQLKKKGVCSPPTGRGVGGLLSYVAESAKVQWKEGQSLEQVLRIQENKTLGLSREIKNERS